MKIRTLVIAAFVLVLALPALAGKKKIERAMLEKMEAVPCGARQRGITGLGSLWASAGIEHVSSDEKLCPQYLLRSDEMEYHIRPTDKKHPAILPVGQEGEFRIDKDKLYLSIATGDRKKTTRSYQVVSMKPTNSDSDRDSTASSRAPQPSQ